MTVHAHSVFKRILHDFKENFFYFKENFTQFLRKYDQFSRKFQAIKKKNFAQFLRKLYVIFWRISCNFCTFPRNRKGLH